MSNFISDYARAYVDIVAALRGDAPVFISRIGGSDTRALVDLRRVRALGPQHLERHILRYLPVVAAHNGFYAFEDTDEAYLRFCDDLLDKYRQSRFFTLSNAHLLSIYFSDEIIGKKNYKENFPNKQEYIELLSELTAQRPEIKCYPYGFVEKLTARPHTLFRALAETLPGKRVLVVSPFSESIQQNFSNREHFFKNFDYPDFSVDFVNVPITYSGLPREFYPHASWFETRDDLIAQIAAKEFDVALLSCGTYAMGIGTHIEEKLMRKAVYVGGVLQLFFGITGRRYDRPQIRNLINESYFIHPLEGNRYMRHVDVAAEAPKEAFGAYF